jgi:hypothetical protein
VTAVQAEGVPAPFAALFDRGLAEVAEYDSRIVQYGHPRKARVTHIWVKEPWDEPRGVKWGGPGRGDFEVIKMNRIQSYATGVYRYEQMWSGFWRRDSGALVKYSLSHHEACGNTYKQLLRRGRSASAVHYSYFEGAGAGRNEWDVPAGGMFYDELPWVLRVRAAQGATGTWSVVLYPTVVHGRPDAFVPAAARIRMEETAKSGEVVFSVDHAGGRDRLVFASTLPHRLLAWDQADGSTHRLVRAEWTDYWNRSGPDRAPSGSR